MVATDNPTPPPPCPALMSPLSGYYDATCNPNHPTDLTGVRPVQQFLNSYIFLKIGYGFKPRPPLSKATFRMLKNNRPQHPN